MFEQESISRPLKDETAKLFLEPSTLFISSILKGNNIGEAKEKSQKLLRENYVNSLSGDSKDIDVARFLWWNLRHFASYGDLKARV